MNTPVQQLPPPAYSYYTFPYPILSFMYGLYCDSDWSEAEFTKWLNSYVGDGQYEYEAYLDPYPNLPHGARKLISERVPAEGIRQDNGRLMPTPPLAEAMWPYLLQELTFNPAAAVSGPSDPKRRSPVRNADRPVLSGLSLIFLRALEVDEAREAFAEYPTELKAKLIEVAATRVMRGQPLNSALSALKSQLVVEFTGEPAVW